MKLKSNGDGELKTDVLKLTGRCDNQEHTGINCQSESGRVVLILIAVSFRHPALLSVVLLRANTKLKSGSTTPSARPGANNETPSIGCSTCASQSPSYHAQSHCSTIKGFSFSSPIHPFISFLTLSYSSTSLSTTHFACFTDISDSTGYTSNG